MKKKKKKKKRKKRQRVKWIPLDVDDVSRIDHSNLPKKPHMERLSPVRCVVNEGEVLYLPSLWFHQVSQRGVTIAVNYWFDMHFGFQWALLQYLELTAKTIITRKTNTSKEEEEEEKEKEEDEEEEK
uniref:JmjC domain-containing protein n=1 Tax=Lotharella oceanica TaxID=641309 RepID=A0A7S2U1H9_9EUKA|mmetsp:Transcript_5797/g.11495  ORF Transcript_5797/g.11495 Transcript_5797/m.11495 type:complete len:127 (+) Transcript_5797:2-382(+)